VGLGARGTRIDWLAVFGREAPLVLDLGCGNGRFLVGSALRRPEVDHFGIDLVPPAVRFASLRAGQRGLTNCKVAWGDATEFLLERCPPASVDEIHLYHPQPYYEPGRIARRQLTPPALAGIHRALKPGGLFVFQTDNVAYARYARAVVPALFAWSERAEPWPDAPQGRTLREITARRQGLSIVRAEARRLDLTEADAAARAAALPAPEFDANRPAFRGEDGPRPPRRRRRRGRGPGGAPRPRRPA
jgi:tRNA (guanine-N7-)-methyltransferase